LRVSAPEGDTGSAPVVGVVAVTPSATTETRPLEAVTLPPLPPAPAPAPAAGPAPAPVTPAPAPAGTPGVPPAADGGAPRPSVQAPAANAGLFWQWPARGKVIDGYHEARNKGIDIGGNEGDAVLAAGDGEIVYSGNGLRMYGNLVIIKHSDDYISAYAHNKQILVKQGQAVKRGQRIADLGRTDDGQAKLHFEIRYRGKPVDPMKYLPPR
jgi:lipoprotein NlpD